MVLKRTGRFNGFGTGSSTTSNGRKSISSGVLAVVEAWTAAQQQYALAYGDPVSSASLPLVRRPDGARTNLCSG